ncbi:MAG: class I poly(R)-hydroxyalkanoic acid synthase [Alphaproteobacteria bacterium]|nr:class I poly(R)-hydroxyalkanoic acid synthase [Alphaproteobacteria bacterium]
MLRFMEGAGSVMTNYFNRADNETTPYSTASEMQEASKTVKDLLARWMMENPAQLAESQAELMRTYAEIWNNSLMKMVGDDPRPVAAPDPSDNRFKDPEWSENPYFDFWKQSYLATTRWAEEMLEKTDGLGERDRQRAEYHFRQLTSALSPSNFPLTNPEVVRETIATNAENLVKGIENLTEDMKKSGDLLKISQTDIDAFEVGRNLATTPGKVIFQNEIMQLIQYTPTTEKVHKRPLLIVPPWINKFYILDLTPPKSFIKWVVEQGFTVFVISWVNPDSSLKDVQFEDYMHKGILTAAKAACEETGEKKLNALGYCVGGTLLATTLAYLSKGKEKDNVFKSVTFLTTQVDFTKAGDLLLFIDDEQLADLDEVMAKRGYLDGSRMANVFNMMRPKDLVWPYIVNNYMLGKKPFPFDLLYWNQDSTRMPAANHHYYLNEFYNENKLAKGELEVSGEKLCLSDIKIPVFNLAAKEDHIAPAQSVFIGAQLFGGPVELVVAGSGHIAGVINPPAKVKYQYWTASKSSAESLEDWMGMAKETTGSWWPYWSEWLSQQSGRQIEAREPGKVLGTLEDAPGSYVKAAS